MTSPAPRDSKVLKLDICFAVLGVTSIIIFITGSYDEVAAIAPPSAPIAAATALIGFTVIMALIFTRFADLDRQKSEEYGFQLLANGAVIGMMTALVGHLLWSFDFLLGYWLEGPVADTIIAMMIGGWSIGYFTYRIRGVAT